MPNLSSAICNARYFFSREEVVDYVSTIIMVVYQALLRAIASTMKLTHMVVRVVVALIR